jgi:hypothetical protein
MCSSAQVSAKVDLAALFAAAPGLAVMAALTQIDPVTLDESDRLVLVEVWDRQQAWVAAQTLTPLVAFAGPAPVDSDDFVREDLRAALHLSRPAAQTRIDVARLLSSTLTATAAALAAGQIGYPQASVLVQAVIGAAPSVALAVEQAVLDRAPASTVGEFGRLVDKAVLAADPQTAHEQHTAAAATRSVVLYPGPAGMATIRADLPAVDAHNIWLALDTLAARKEPGDPRGIDARRADALTALAATALTSPDVPRRHRRRTQIQIVTDLPTLLGLTQHPAQLTGYGPIPAPVARALAADATWQRLVVEPVTGHLLDAGTTTYRPPQELIDYILTRDPTCTFPTCHTPAAACDIDHTTPWQPDHPQGGTTSTCNCHPACRHHHRLKTHGGWTVTAHPDGTTTWTNPHGRNYHSPTHDHRPWTI